MRLIEYHDANRRRNTRTMSDQSLQDELMSITMQTIQQRPELAIEAAQRLGWRICLPEPPQAG